MIASLRGPVLALSTTGAVIECGGVGLAITLTPAARKGLRLGEQASLLTHLVVKEDSLSLYGFADDAEREVFITVQSVSGVGPRIALGLLGTLTPTALIQAVASGDVAQLTRVPGIGKKGAQKLILELSGKLGQPLGDTLPGAEPAGALAGQVCQALESLGWPAAAASQAVAEVMAREDAPDEVGGLLKASLRLLGGNRGQ
ncbi:MAG: Holliday junction branch migration protein RuvA [Micrococcales bacterium]|nr:Holliday junction branch migration protein RuvA [Micrococcales bacterium]